MDFAFDSGNFKSLKSNLESLKPKSKTTISQNKSLYTVLSPRDSPEG